MTLTEVKTMDYQKSMQLNIPPLSAADVECRVQQCTAKGVSLLLYKNARCDMRMLDEVVGPLNWKREHSRDNANCTVSIWDYEKEQWVSKEDCGTESNTEAEKGLCSDSFKRACSNWGFGRELYTAPFIWVPAEKIKMVDTEKTDKYGKPVFRCNTRFEVSRMEVENGKITALCIFSDMGLPVFEWRAAKPIAQLRAENGTKAPTSPRTAKRQAVQPQTENPAQATVAANDVIVCEDCRKPIAPYTYTSKDGQQVTLTPAQVAGMGLKSYGKRVCAECAAKRKAAKKGASNA